MTSSATPHRPSTRAGGSASSQNIPLAHRASSIGRFQPCVSFGFYQIGHLPFTKITFLDTCQKTVSTLGLRVKWASKKKARREELSGPFNGPIVFYRAVPCRPTGWSGGPSPARPIGPRQHRHGCDRAVPGLGQAKKAGFRAGCRVAGCMDICNPTHDSSLNVHTRH